ncbi:uncharacterized protein LOC6548570 [Drosophila erecta]|uniref:Ecdysis triggering hormone n=1 Tax=Drosophila erecta TaxID=7220 RepID=B3NQZ2_DROER|nr:uncharacterized protein LOC6548570 [Drosophila erecta]EDV57075.1 uncharacterized protein Dere_GG19887 [Drosophila erecta]
MRFITVLSVSLLVALVAISQADDSSPGFFLKITKNVPRLGKRGENFAIKNLRTIPRIGRSEHSSVTPLLAWLWDLDTSPSKRRLPAGESAAKEQELNVVQPVNSNTLLELLDNNAIPSEQVKFVHWKDFDRALQADADLYNKVIQLGRRPDQHLKQTLSFGSYVPIFGDDQNPDFMMYKNNEDQELYGGGNRYDRHFLKYNTL